MAGSLPAEVLLRDAMSDDLPMLYEFQLDPEATAMAAFPARDWVAFEAHWTRIMADESVTTKVILADGRVAGSISCFEMDGQREVGYWIGRAFWGQGVATRALALLLELDATRPLYAHVAKHNVGSRRVLEKCGFTVIGEDSSPFGGSGSEAVEEYVLQLDANDAETL